TVTATDTTDSGITGQATTQVVHGAAASVLLTLVPDTIPADGAAHSTATAAVADTFGNAVPGDDVTITSPGDVTVSSVTDHGDGTYTADITASTTFGSNQVTAADGVHSDS